MCFVIDDIIEAVVAVVVTTTELASDVALPAGVAALGLEGASLIACAEGDASIAGILGEIGKVFGAVAGVAGGVSNLVGGAEELALDAGTDEAEQAGSEIYGGAVEGSGDAAATSTTSLNEASSTLRMMSGFGHLALTFAGKSKAASYLDLLSSLGGSALSLGQVADAGGTAALVNSASLSTVVTGVQAGASATELGLMASNNKGLGAELLGLGSGAFGDSMEIASRVSPPTGGLELVEPGDPISGTPPPYTAVIGGSAVRVAPLSDGSWVALDSNYNVVASGQAGTPPPAPLAVDPTTGMATNGAIGITDMSASDGGVSDDSSSDDLRGFPQRPHRGVEYYGGEVDSEANSYIAAAGQPTSGLGAPQPVALTLSDGTYIDDLIHTTDVVTPGEFAMTDGGRWVQVVDVRPAPPGSPVPFIYTLAAPTPNQDLIPQLADTPLPAVGDASSGGDPLQDGDDQGELVDENPLDTELSGEGLIPPRRNPEEAALENQGAAQGVRDIGAGLFPPPPSSVGESLKRAAWQTLSLPVTPVGSLIQTASAVKSAVDYGTSLVQGDRYQSSRILARTGVGIAGSVFTGEIVGGIVGTVADLTNFDFSSEFQSAVNDAAGDGDFGLKPDFDLSGLQGAAGELGAVAPTAAELETAYLNQGFAQVEAQTMAEVQTAIDGGAVGRLQDAFRAGESVDVVVGNRVVTVEPGAPFSGFTDMEGNTYAIGREAFASEEELVSTMLHETYRLNTSVVRSGQAIGHGVASAETATTFDFAQRAVGSMKK